MNDKYVSLHQHSVYSLYDGLGRPADYVKKAVEYGHQALAITDHGRCGGFIEHRDECLKNGIKPITGVEAYVTDKLITLEGEKRKRTKNNHVILLAKNKVGYQNLLRLNYLSNFDESHFYYSPRISFDEMFEHREGLICGTACLASAFSNLIKREKPEQAEELFLKYLEVFKENLYAEIQLNEVTTPQEGYLIRGQITYNNWLIEQATRHGVPIVVSGDVHYTEKEDYKVQELSFNLRSEKEVDEEFVCKSLYYHNTDSFLRFNKEFGYNYKEDDLKSWIANSCYIASKIDFVIPERDRMILPRMAFDEEGTLFDKVKEGLNNYFNGEIPQEYKDRATTEFNLIKKKGIARYFLLLEDICQFADKEEISRGISRGCFLPDEKVSMSDGTEKEISNVNIGDVIISGFNINLPVKNKLEYNIDEEISSVVLKNGDVINCTKDHKILVIKKGLEKNLDNAIWVEAENISSGDLLVKDLQ